MAGITGEHHARKMRPLDAAKGSMSFAASMVSRAVRSRMSSAAALIGMVAMVGTGAAAAPANAASRPGTPALACRAVVSDAHPSKTTVVYVLTAAGARVTISAHYKTTTNTESARANRAGIASTSYYTGGATPGYKVVVTVLVQSGSRVGACLTSYVPV